ncbi:B12-binding domain-containing radical SAM protein [Kitasatospora sp. NPDC058046]|uniref:B12-binding domain-containing radical SAM protein n=1 Tax=Kitasatospora sp. NPDC058046 TaxID=3346312 RepID=UPI0036DC3528
MSVLAAETAAIRASEIPIVGPYPTDRPNGALRVVFLIPYGHAYSLMCNGPMSLYDLVNRTAGIPAYAERALQYDNLVRDGNRLTTPDGEPYRTIESAAPVHQADIVGVSVTNSGDLHSVLRLLDLAGIPRRSADRVPGIHPLVVGGNAGLANPEVLADYLDVVAMGEAEVSFAELLRTLHVNPRTPENDALVQISRIPGLYVPALYEYDFAPGGGVLAVRPKAPTVPATVDTQFLELRDLHDAHFTYPITDGTAAGLIPVLGCKHSCHFCTLGVPPFREVPIEILTAYLDRVEELGVERIIISAPTFTQYRRREELLNRIRAYSDRAAEHGVKVTTIIGSVRADEMTSDYLRDINDLGNFGHLFTELNLTQARGIITIAPEFASPELLDIYYKTMRPERVNKTIEQCRNTVINTVMLYFIVGAPGERPEDRLAIADRAKEIRELLDRPDAAVIVKLHGFMPKPGTPGQRLRMTDPEALDRYGDEIAARLRDLVGQNDFDQHYRVQFGEKSRLYLEAICLRGDRRIGHVLEDLYDNGMDPTDLPRDVLVNTLAAHGLDFARHLRHMDDPVLPWHVFNDVDPTTEQTLIKALNNRPGWQ